MFINPASFPILKYWFITKVGGRGTCHSLNHKATISLSPLFRSHSHILFHAPETVGEDSPRGDKIADVYTW